MSRSRDERWRELTEMAAAWNVKLDLEKSPKVNDLVNSYVKEDSCYLRYKQHSNMSRALGIDPKTKRQQELQKMNGK